MRAGYALPRITRHVRFPPPQKLQSTLKVSKKYHIWAQIATAWTTIGTAAEAESGHSTGPGRLRGRGSCRPTRPLPRLGPHGKAALRGNLLEGRNDLGVKLRAGAAA